MSVVKPQIFNYMAKNKEQKNKIVSNLKEKISQMKSLVFFGYEGLTVKDIEDLRRKCKEAGIEYTVPKKTLLSVAMKEAGVEVNPKDIKENYGIAISLKDEVVVAKILHDFVKAHEAAKILGGVFFGKLADQTMVLQLAKLPSREQLLAKLVGSINAPVSGFVNVLAGNLRGLVQVLNSIKNKK